MKPDCFIAYVHIKSEFCTYLHILYHDEEWLSKYIDVKLLY